MLIDGAAIDLEFFDQLLDTGTSEIVEDQLGDLLLTKTGHRPGWTCSDDTIYRFIHKVRRSQIRLLTCGNEVQEQRG